MSKNRLPTAPKPQLNSETVEAAAGGRFLSTAPNAKYRFDDVGWYAALFVMRRWSLMPSSRSDPLRSGWFETRM